MLSLKRILNPLKKSEKRLLEKEEKLEIVSTFLKDEKQQNLFTFCSNFSQFFHQIWICILHFAIPILICLDILCILILVHTFSKLWCLMRTKQPKKRWTWIRINYIFHFQFSLIKLLKLLQPNMHVVCPEQYNNKKHMHWWTNLWATQHLSVGKEKNRSSIY